MRLPRLFRRRGGDTVPVRRMPADPVSSLRQEMDRLFDDFSRSLGLEIPWPGEAWGPFTPSVEVDESDAEVRVTAELPGLEEKDFELVLQGDHLVLRGEKRHESQEEREGWTRSERLYGAFERAIPLPCEVEADRAEAQYRHGVLRVVLPKSAEARSRRIRIPVRAS